MALIASLLLFGVLCSSARLISAAEDCSGPGLQALTGTLQFFVDDDDAQPVLLLPAGTPLRLALGPSAAGLDLESNTPITIFTNTTDLEAESRQVYVNCLKVHPARRSLQSTVVYSSKAGFKLTSITYVYTICGKKPPSTEAVRKMLFDTDYSLASFFKTCSFNTASMTTGDNIIVPISIPCGAKAPDGRPVLSPSPGAGCSLDNAMRARMYADRVAENNLGINIGRFARRINVMPSICPRLAVATQGCSQGWCDAVMSGEASYSDPGNYIHELGHTLGLSHAATNADQYGDSSSPLGWCCGGNKCYNAVQQGLLGWSLPMVTLPTSSLPSGQWKTYSIPALSASRTSFIKLQAGSQDLYVSYRARTGCDSGLVDGWANQVHVHTFRPGGFPLEINNRPVLAGKLTPSETWRDKGAKLAVAYISKQGSTATISICRFTSASQCKHK